MDRTKTSSQAGLFAKLARVLKCIWHEPNKGAVMVNKAIFKTYLGKLLPRTDAKNHHAAPAYKLTPREALAQYAVTGMSFICPFSAAWMATLARNSGSTSRASAFTASSCSAPSA